MSELSLLGVFAHPDDEQTMSGALAKAAAEGIKTGLICATRGEMGEIAEPSLATSDNLGSVREAEMRAACTVLGVKYLWFLDYRDSGMMGTPGNDDPTCFYRVQDEEALERMVKLIRQFRPTVMVTFDETGGYGHPDHLTVYRLATLAFDAAANPDLYTEAGPAWTTRRLYYSSFPRSAITRMSDWLKEQGIPNPFGEVDMSTLGMDDNIITNAVDVSEWVAVKDKSLQMHRTQMNPDSPFTKIPPEIVTQIRSVEYYALGMGEPLPAAEGWSPDLFAGLR